ncbi:MAG: hypothetical protein WKG00_09905 [Polyangiaceae bacterium]
MSPTTQMCVASLPQIPIRSTLGTFPGSGAAAALELVAEVGAGAVAAGGTLAVALGGGAVAATVARGGEISGASGLALQPAAHAASAHDIALEEALRIAAS